MVSDNLIIRRFSVYTKVRSSPKAHTAHQTQAYNQQINQYIDALKQLQQSETIVLEKGREEYQLLQESLRQTLMKLQTVSSPNDTDINTALSKLQNLQTATQNELKALTQLLGELESVKMDMLTSLDALKQQQASLNLSLAQFQPLLKP